MQFLKLSDSLGVGNTKNDQYLPLDQFSSCILVGVTGVGKTTLKARLLEKYNFYPLPGRRALTDKIILPLVLPKDKIHKPVHDRCRRFAYTKAFRDLHPGGMGYVLSQIKIKMQSPSKPVLFDGLRGVDEVRYAACAMPSAFFIVLTVPDHLRIKRLLVRQDSFDHAEDGTALDPAWFEKIVSPGQCRELFDYVHKHGIPETKLYKKTRIVIKEKDNYDQEATRRFLMETVPDRTFAMDSSKHSPNEIIAAIDKHLQRTAMGHCKDNGKN